MSSHVAYILVAPFRTPCRRRTYTPQLTARHGRVVRIDDLRMRQHKAVCRALPRRDMVWVLYLIRFVKDTERQCFILRRKTLGRGYIVVRLPVYPAEIALCTRREAGDLKGRKAPLELLFFPHELDRRDHGRKDRLADVPFLRAAVPPVVEPRLRHQRDGVDFVRRRLCRRTPRRLYHLRYLIVKQRRVLFRHPNRLYHCNPLSAQ